jgi:hypothetical protein
MKEIIFDMDEEIGRMKWLPKARRAWLNFEIDSYRLEINPDSGLHFCLRVINKYGGITFRNIFHKGNLFYLDIKKNPCLVDNIIDCIKKQVLPEIPNFKIKVMRVLLTETTCEEFRWFANRLLDSLPDPKEGVKGGR